MGVSATGGSGRSVRSVTTVLLVILGMLIVGFYLYGPPAAPKMRAAAAEACNQYAGGDYRSYQLSWHVGATPHWVCRDSRDKDREPVDLGWWVGKVPKSVS